MRISEAIASEALLAVQDDSQSGFCIECGTEHCECEPDTRRRTCDDCGAAQVYGAEEILIMAW